MHTSNTSIIMYDRQWGMVENVGMTLRNIPIYVFKEIHK